MKKKLHPILYEQLIDFFFSYIQYISCYNSCIHNTMTCIFMYATTITTTTTATTITTTTTLHTDTQKTIG